MYLNVYFEKHLDLHLNTGTDLACSDHSSCSLKENSTGFKHQSLFTGVREHFWICEKRCIKASGSRGSSGKADKLPQVMLSQCQLSL